MRQAFDEGSTLCFRKTFNRIHEVHMRLAALQKSDEVIAQRLIVIYRLAFLLADTFCFFLHEDFLFLRKKQPPRRVWGHRWTLRSRRLEVTNYIRELPQNASSCGKSIARKLSDWHTFFSRNRQEAIDETRISPLVLSPAWFGTRRSCLWTLGPAAAGLPDQCGRRNGTRRPEDGRRAGRFHRWRKNQVLHREFDQRAELLQQGSTPVSPQLCAIRVRLLFARRGRALHLEQLPDRGHCHLHDGRFLRRLPRREQPLQAPGRYQALLRDVGRIRPAALHGRHVRRQFLSQ